MRIAVDGMLLGRRTSGVEGSIARLVQALAARGTHAYGVFTQVPGNDATRIATRWPVRLRPMRILWQQTALPVALARGHFDLLHAPGYVAPVLSPAPVVLTLFDVIALRHPDLCTPPNRWHYRAMIPLSVRKARRIIVPSEATRDDVLRLMPHAAGKIDVIPLGIDGRFSVMPDAAARASVREACGGERPFILFVGGLEPKKNVVRLIEAYSLLRQRCAPPHRLVIAGALSWDRLNIEHGIRAAGLQEHVILAGYVPDSWLPALYRAADCFVFPSLYEGFGLPPLEAMACGTPVIVSDRGALPETAGPAALSVDPLRPAEIADAMEAVLSQRDLRADLIARGLRHAAAFNWDRVAEATEAVYEACMVRRRAP